MIDPLKFVDYPELHEPDAELRAWTRLPLSHISSRLEGADGVMFEVDPLTHDEQCDCSRILNYGRLKASQASSQAEASRWIDRANEAEELLVVSSLRLVGWALRKYRSYLLPCEDGLEMFSEAVQGLQQCICRWDYRRAALSTFAAEAIRWRILKWLRKERKNRPVQFSDDGPARASQIPGRAEPDQVEIEGQRDQVGRLLNSLSDRQRQFVELYFGFVGEPRSAEEIGEQFGISAGRVRQVIGDGLSQLRERVARTVPADSPEAARLKRDGVVPVLATAHVRKPIPDWLLQCWAEVPAASLTNIAEKAVAAFERRAIEARAAILRRLLRSYDRRTARSAQLGDKDRGKLFRRFPEWLATIWNTPAADVAEFKTVAKRWGRKVDRLSAAKRRWILVALLGAVENDRKRNPKTYSARASKRIRSKETKTRTTN